MGIKFYKPTSPGRRDGSVLDYKELTTSTPEKSLLRPIKKWKTVKREQRS